MTRGDSATWITRGILTCLQVVTSDSHGYLNFGDIIHQNTIIGYDGYKLKILRAGSSEYKVRVYEEGVSHIGSVSLKNIVLKLI